MISLQLVKELSRGRGQMAAPFGSFHASLKAVRAKTLPEEPSDGAKACQKLVSLVQRRLCSRFYPRSRELPEKLSRLEEAFQHSHAEPLSFDDAITPSVITSLLLNRKRS